MWFKLTVLSHKEACAKQTPRSKKFGIMCSSKELALNTYYTSTVHITGSYTCRNHPVCLCCQSVLVFELGQGYNIFRLVWIWMRFHNSVVHEARVSWPWTNVIFPRLWSQCLYIKISVQVITFYYTPRNEVRGGYTGITLSVRPSVCLSVCPSVDARLGKMVSSA